MRQQERASQHTPAWSVFLMALVALTLGAAVARVWAAGLDEAEVFLELNHTDRDLGIHASIDGGPYVLLEIEDPHERTILRVTAHGRLANQGLTQLFLESAEPPFDELDPGDFFLRFPEGFYEIRAVTYAGEEFETKVKLSHVLAAPTSNVTVNGVPAAEHCEAPQLPSVHAPVVIAWDPVTSSHPEIGKPGHVKIARYQFFVEREDVSFGVDLPPTVTAFEVPSAITDLGGEFKFEIIARTTAGNNTAIESCFEIQQ